MTSKTLDVVDSKTLDVAKRGQLRKAEAAKALAKKGINCFMQGKQMQSGGVQVVSHAIMQLKAVDAFASLADYQQFAWATLHISSDAMKVAAPQVIQYLLGVKPAKPSVVSPTQLENITVRTNKEKVIRQALKLAAILIANEVTVASFKLNTSKIGASYWELPVSMFADVKNKCYFVGKLKTLPLDGKPVTLNRESDNAQKIVKRSITYLFKVHAPRKATTTTPTAIDLDELRKITPPVGQLAILSNEMLTEGETLVAWIDLSDEEQQAFDTLLANINAMKEVYSSYTPEEIADLRKAS